MGGGHTGCWASSRPHLHPPLVASSPLALAKASTIEAGATPVHIARALRAYRAARLALLLALLIRAPNLGSKITGPTGQLLAACATRRTCPESAFISCRCAGQCPIVSETCATQWRPIWCSPAASSVGPAARLRRPNGISVGELPLGARGIGQLESDPGAGNSSFPVHLVFEASSTRLQQDASVTNTLTDATFTLFLGHRRASRGRLSFSSKIRLKKIKRIKSPFVNHIRLTLALEPWTLCALLVARP